MHKQLVRAFTLLLLVLPDPKPFFCALHGCCSGLLHGGDLLRRCNLCDPKTCLGYPIFWHACGAENALWQGRLCSKGEHDIFLLASSFDVQNLCTVISVSLVLRYWRSRDGEQQTCIEVWLLEGG